MAEPIRPKSPEMLHEEGPDKPLGTGSGFSSFDSNDTEPYRVSPSETPVAEPKNPGWLQWAANLATAPLKAGIDYLSSISAQAKQVGDLISGKWRSNQTPAIEYVSEEHRLRSELGSRIPNTPLVTDSSKLVNPEDLLAPQVAYFSDKPSQLHHQISKDLNRTMIVQINNTQLPKGDFDPQQYHTLMGDTGATVLEADKYAHLLHQGSFAHDVGLLFHHFEPLGIHVMPDRNARMAISVAGTNGMLSFTSECGIRLTSAENPEVTIATGVCKTTIPDLHHPDQWHSETAFKKL
ncbi:MAG: hypothetical protein V4534_08960 [Myxococcota bacterium]